MLNIPELLNVPGLDTAMERVEEALGASVAGEDLFLSEVAGHLIGAGGKRLRPALCVAAAAAGGAEATDAVVLGGVAVELVHMGSLYHDDVIDEATSRRGVASVNARWGNLVAILAGDFLLAKASEIAAGLGTEVAALLAVQEGEVGVDGQARLVQPDRQPALHLVQEERLVAVGAVGGDGGAAGPGRQTAFSLNRTEEAYLASIAGKTAALLAAACRIGGLAGGLDRPLVEQLTRFGHSIGMVFQIRDDVLDVVGTDEQLGKPAGNDLVEGVYTLPVIRALADPVAGPELAELLGRRLDELERDTARRIVRSSAGVEAALEAGRRYADEAAGAAGRVGTGPVPDAFSRLGHRLLDDLAG